ncbi:Phage portal protein [Tenacibaculum sp. 190524A02b]|uniref:Phage portal protein n=1 Tax=Tenacibaculum vairaonense TaxID=3137860 RepID=A0ABP1FAZ1_9FLAO
MLFQALQNEFKGQSVSSGFGLWPSITSSSVVNTSSALTLSAFYNAVDIISNDFAKLPKSLYQKIEGDRKKKPDHSINYILSRRPNKLMTSFMFDKMMIQYAILKGNAYAIIERDYKEKVVALHLVEQDKTSVTVWKKNKKLYYEIDGEMYSSDDVIHVPGFSFDGITGIGVVSFAAKSLGVNLKSQNFADEYYDSKGEGIAVVTSSKSMDSDAKIRLSNAITSRLSQKGMVKATVLDESNTFQHIKLTPQESQFLQTNSNGVLEVARWLNLPPHKLKSLENATFSNIEHQEIAHVSDSVLPWSLKFQNEYTVKLLSVAEEIEGYYIKFNTKSLLRADLKAQSEFFSKMIYAGVYTRNEVRALFELNALEGLDSPLTPVNTNILEQIDALLKQKQDG